MDNKFGMFIHWGLYSLGGLHEQEFARYDRTREEYEKYADEFNPVNFNPDEIVMLAKNAGMKYICFTTKHHDGFCMWDTKYTDYNIMNTPYQKDILKMLADSCKRHSMKLSLYYSNPDWHHEYGYNPNSSHQWKAKRDKSPNTEIYREYIKNQITELLTNYGEIYTLFWDIPPEIEDRSINELVRKLQPNIYINNRGFDEGDFSTPEREFEDMSKIKRFEKMTEACNSVSSQSWGYRKNDDIYSVRYLTCAIDKIMAMGGSYLLNIGPKGDGSIDKSYSDKIKRVGDWYNRMEGSLENAEADDFDYQIANGNCIVNKKNGKSYFNFYDGIDSTAVAMKEYPSVPKSVRLLNNGENLKFNVELLPGYYDFETGRADGEYLHIYGIPVDDFASEPIVLEVEW